MVASPRNDKIQVPRIASVHLRSETPMGLFSRHPNDWQVVQQVRAEFIINAIRNRLSESTIWHEKRFAPSQLESLCLVSPHGVYYIDTFDAKSPKFPPDKRFTVVDDLAIRIRHDARSHPGIGDQSLQQLIQTANAEFNALARQDRDSLTGAFRRLTCVLEAYAPTETFEHDAKIVFETISHFLNCEFSYLPYNLKEVWLPTSDLYDAKPSPDHQRLASEFLFDHPREVANLTTSVESLLQSTGSLRAPGIQGTIRSVAQRTAVHLIGRRY